MASSSLPKVAVLVSRTAGRRHLDACLSSLETQSYPRSQFEVQVVDAGAAGCAARINAAVQQCQAEHIAVLGGGWRADARWLSELVAAADRHSASAVGSRMVDASGRSDSLESSGLSLAGLPMPSASHDTAGLRAEDRVLFPTSAALFQRSAFLDAGGLDESFLGVFEHVDLGWRLNVLGQYVVFAPQAVAYQQEARRPSPADRVRRLRLCERNALAMIYKQYETRTLERVLPAAVALSLTRGLTGSGVDTLALPLSSRPPDTVAIAPEAVAHLIALEDFCRRLPALEQARAAIQERRRTPDQELWPLFAQPLRLQDKGGAPGSPIHGIADTLVRDLGIDALISSGKNESPQGPAVDATGHPGPAGPGGFNRAARARTEVAASWPSQTPKVSIVILTALGATHLGECLASLRDQTYPADRIEVIVVDNASAEDPTAAAEAGFPGVRVIRNASNVGFARGNNIGAAAATGDWLIFLNDDTRVAPDWLAQLVATARRRGASAVASRILDWSGTRIDFVDGAVNFQGKGFQLHYDAPVDSIALDEKPLLFACGCAVLIDRGVFMSTGQWDEGTFAYYEDVELGWRLNLLGHAVWLAPAAVVHHKHHGTSGRWPEPPRVRLYERNSLRMLYELLETGSLTRVLPAALLLSADRALLSTTLSRATDIAPASPAEAVESRLTLRRIVASAKGSLRRRGVTRTMSIGRALRWVGIRGLAGVVRDAVGARVVAGAPARRPAYLVERVTRPGGALEEMTPEVLPIEAAAMLSGLYGFLADLPAVSQRRADVQQRRRTTDAEIVTRFGSHWNQQCPARHQHEHNTAHAILVGELGLTHDEMVATPHPATSPPELGSPVASAT